MAAKPDPSQLACRNHRVFAELPSPAPFLFFNGNTFADVGRTIVDFVFAELTTGRRREVMSAVAHYIAGVLPREAMVEIVEGLCESAEFKPGDREKTLRGSTQGVILDVLPDSCCAPRQA